MGYLYGKFLRRFHPRFRCAKPENAVSPSDRCGGGASALHSAERGLGQPAHGLFPWKSPPKRPVLSAGASLDLLQSTDLTFQPVAGLAEDCLLDLADELPHIGAGGLPVVDEKAAVLLADHSASHP